MRKKLAIKSSTISLKFPRRLFSDTEPHFGKHISPVQWKARIQRWLQLSAGQAAALGQLNTDIYSRVWGKRAGSEQEPQTHHPYSPWAAPPVLCQTLCVPLPRARSHCDTSPATVPGCSNSGMAECTTPRSGKEKHTLNARPAAWFFSAWISILSTGVHCVLALPKGGNTLQFLLLQITILLIRPVIAIKRKNSQFYKLYRSRTPYCQQTCMRGTS